MVVRTQKLKRLHGATTQKKKMAVFWVVAPYRTV
jgi:hypothetical protein